MDAERRKRVAAEFLRMAARGDAEQARDRYLTPKGVHHNMFFPAGWGPLIAAMEQASKERPDKSLTIKQVIGEGDLVAVHSHVVQRPGEAGGAVVHIFRFEGDRIAEMWDIGQEIPRESPNADGAF